MHDPSCCPRGFGFIDLPFAPAPSPAGNLPHPSIVIQSARQSPIEPTARRLASASDSLNILASATNNVPIWKSCT